MMLLADAYCVANRVRGVDLVSPKDFLKACEMMNQQSMPVRMRVFESGVHILELATQSDNELVHDLLSLVRKCDYITSSKLAENRGMSVVLATEQLLLAERHGKLCRDESVAGLRFYPNLFVEMSR